MTAREVIQAIYYEDFLVDWENAYLEANSDNR